ncbi:MAG: hypothetical protein Q9221_002954 [Calogaya cf. arnoldii]
MGDPTDSKQSSKPDWQHNEASESDEALETSSKTTDAPEHVEPPPPRAALLEQASKFLKDDEIRHAPTDRQIAFLQSKGLTDEEVYRLLGLPYDGAKPELQKGPGPKQALSDPSLPSVQDPSAASSQRPPPPSPPKETPPIITYPEFLLHSEKPPPLITASRLINTFYLFSGTAAAIYGTSKYLVEPMLDSLTSARHDLYSTAQSNLDGMLERLEKNVSVIPSGVSKGIVEDDEDTSADEDMADTTPFFNRTVGTQTSPPASLSPASSDSLSAPATTIASLQQRTLGSLQASLLSVIPPKATGSEKDSLAYQLDDLKRYLNTLQYPSLHRDGLAETKDDAVNEFKNEIKRMKGSLLNARNFPSGNSTGRGFRGRVGE